MRFCSLRADKRASVHFGFSNTNRQKQSKSSRFPTRFASVREQRNRPAPSKILNRCPIQNRREQARQQPSAGIARRCPAQFASAWEQRNRPEPSKSLNRFPIQNRREQARQQLSAGTARRSDNCQRIPTAQTKQIAPLFGAICVSKGTKKTFRTKQEFESLPDSKSS